MKQIYFLPITLIIFFITACKTSTTVPYKVSINKVKGIGGNPEVYLNQCLNKKGRERDICIDYFYPEDIEIGIYPKDGLHIKLAGRSSSVKRKELIIDTQDRIILSIDTTNIKLPITSNINPIKKLQHKNHLAIIIEVKDIESSITLKDKKGKLLLDYKIIKQKN